MTQQVLDKNFVKSLKMSQNPEKSREILSTF